MFQAYIEPSYYLPTGGTVYSLLYALLFTTSQMQQSVFVEVITEHTQENCHTNLRPILITIAKVTNTDRKSRDFCDRFFNLRNLNLTPII